MISLNRWVLQNLLDSLLRDIKSPAEQFLADLVGTQTLAVQIENDSVPRGIHHARFISSHVQSFALLRGSNTVRCYRP